MELAKSLVGKTGKFNANKWRALTDEERDKILNSHPKLKEKTKQSNMKKYETGHPSRLHITKEKVKQTNLERYGVVYPSQLEDTKLHVRWTNLEKYGVEYPMQCPKFSSNVRLYKQKDYILPNNEIIKVQGYEPVALDILFKLYTIDDIKMLRVDVPEIWYMYNGKQKRYYPDIFVVPENKIIEVKSIRTYSMDVDKLKAKADRCKEMGFSYEFWICSRVELLEVVKI